MSWHRSIEEIQEQLRSLGDAATSNSSHSLDPNFLQQLQDVVFWLELFIPGLDPPPDQETARQLLSGARAALDREDARTTLSRALKGLSFSPHEPQLFYIAAEALFELGLIELAMRLLCHTLWIHPGYRQARADLESLSAFLDDDSGRE